MYPTHVQIECKFVVDVPRFRVNKFRNNEYPQKQENLNDLNFLS